MLSVVKIHYNYIDNQAVSDVSFQLEAGKHLCIMGESGCGKSTLLKAIYGLVDLASGQIFFEGNKVKGPAFNLIPGHQQMKYLAQDFGLMPFHSVAENVGKFLSNIELDKKRERIAELLSVVEMQHYAQRKAHLLSGGEKQRVALAVALANEPKLLLLDEPFGQVDEIRKVKLQKNLFNYLKTKNISCIVATHDSREALQYADEILVMKDGKMKAQGTPESLYSHQDDIYTASLFGELTIWKTDDCVKFLRPYELVVSTKSGESCAVTQSYYQGRAFLTEAEAHFGKVYVETQEKIEIGQKIYVSIRK